MINFLEKWSEFHLSLIHDLLSRVRVKESDPLANQAEIKLPVVTYIQTKPDQQPWYEETNIHEKLTYSLTDHNGLSHEVVIDIMGKLSEDDLAMVKQQMLQVHNEGERYNMNDLLPLNSASLAKFITPDSFTMVASENGVPIAFVLLNKVPNYPEEAREILIEVTPCWRKSGVATLLFFATLDFKRLKPASLPSVLTAEFASVNTAVFLLLAKAKSRGNISYILVNHGPATEAQINIIDPE